MDRAFSPAWGSTISIANAAASAAAVSLPKNCNALLLTNTSATARAHVALTQYGSEGGAAPTGNEPTTSTGLPILPNQQIVVYIGIGPSVIRAIATAADGDLLVTPGNFW